MNGEATQGATKNVSKPVTPDGRYFVFNGRLWRCTNPLLSEHEISAAKKQLMSARSKLRKSYIRDHPDEEAALRRDVHEAKLALGERGDPWWTDGAPDYNRKMVLNTPYKDWYEGECKKL